MACHPLQVNGISGAGEIESAIERFHQLNILEEAWRSANPSQGGRHALNGFRFQLLCTLEKLLAQAPQATRRLAPETLADILETNGETVVAIEVKATLSSGALGHALDQLWRIERLALDLVPNLAPQLSYRIFHCRPGVRDPQASIERWAAENATADEIASFKKKVGIERKVSVLNDIAARLVNDFQISDPFERISQWLGELVQASENATFEETCERIWLEARACWTQAREHSSDLHVWTSDDRPPSTVSRETSEAKQVLTGQRVDRRYLREGRFANRHRYSDLHEAAETWIEGLDRAKPDRLNGFWIAGRSGSGKSVALLHLLASLHSQDSNRIILWMDDRFHKVEDAVKWALPMMEAGLDVILAVDDPYQPGIGLSASSILNGSLRLLQNRSETAPDLHMPIFVFCGPPEQFEAFAGDTSDDLEIEAYHLPPERPTDIAELREWYLKRTGKAELPTEGEDVLLVQIFFEWQMDQPIEAFAKRFRKRLKAMMQGREDSGSIFDTVARILAIRRVYSSYPKAALDAAFTENPALERAFSQLAQEDHHFEIVPRYGEIRFTHPHLADAIYRAWFGGRTDGPFRSQHLAAGIEAWWTAGDDPAQRLKPLWAIEGLLTAIGQEGWDALSPRWELIADIGKPVLERIYQKQIAEMDERAAYLPVWARLEARLGLELRPSAVESLAVVVETYVHADALAMRGFPLACRTLIHLAADQDSPTLAPVQQLLNTRPGWGHWPAVAFKHGQRFGLDAIIVGARIFIDERHFEAYANIRQIFQRRETTPSELERQLTIEWLRINASRSSDDRFQAYVILGYLDVFGLDEDIRHFTADFLSTRLDHASWSYCWEELWALDPAGRPALAIAGLKWLRQPSSSENGWAFVFERLIEDTSDHAIQPARLLALGRRWLLLHPNDDAWPRIWAMVWEKVEEASMPRLRTLALEWLHSIDRKGWSHVWGLLWSDPWTDAQELRCQGVEFLEGNTKHPGWARVWDQLWSDPDGDKARVRSLGAAFLKAEPRHSGWSWVWDHIWADPDQDLEALREMGVAYLEADLSQSGWTGVWGPLWSDLERDEKKLRALGLELMKGNPCHPGWPWVWEQLWAEASEDTEALRDRGLVFLQSGLTLARWARVWTSLWAVSGSDMEDLRRLGLAFLEAEPQHPSWPMVWVSLWSEAEEEEVRLRNLAMTFLEANPKHPHWKLTWAPLWDDPERDEAKLRTMGLAFMEANPDCLGWTGVWGPLWAHPGADETRLRELALAFLDVNVAHPAWTWLWDQMWARAGSARSWLRDRALTFLEDTIEHPRWNLVWAKLWRDGERDEIRLRTGALAFLAANPDCPGWTGVWGSLWADPKGDDVTLRELALEFLRRRPVPSNWHWALEQIWTNPGGKADELREMGRTFLENNGENPGWGRVWNLQLSRSPRDAEKLLAIGLEFVRTNPDHPGWSWVWIPLWKETEGKTELSELALAWFGMASVSGGWSMVWNRLWDWGECDPARLRAVAETLLVRVPPKSSLPLGTRLTAAQPALLDDYSWSDSWERRWGVANDGGRARLVAEGLGKLADPPANLGGWSKVWLLAWDSTELTDPDRARLAALGSAWLDQTDVGHRRWIFVWLALWDYVLGGADEQRLAGYGHRYLEYGSIDQSYLALWTRLVDRTADSSNLFAIMSARRACWPDGLVFPLT